MTIPMLQHKYGARPVLFVTSLGCALFLIFKAGIASAADVPVYAPMSTVDPVPAQEQQAVAQAPQLSVSEPNTTAPQVPESLSVGQEQVEPPQPETAAEPQAPDVPEPQKPSILAVVDRARALLDQALKDLNERNPKPVVINSSKELVPITLAVWNRTTDEIALVEAKKSGSKLQILTPGNWPIKVATANGVNSTYAIADEMNSMVIGVLFPDFKEVKVKKTTKYELHYAVHIPNSSEFYIPEVLAAGSDYLSFLIQDAFDELRAKQVHSVTYPDRLLVDVVDPYLVKSIMVIEHSDSRIYSDDAPERAVGAFLMNLALNREKAFGSSTSSAGAVGIAQFIPSTYALLVKRRPELGLIADFKAGMADHKNAIKAQVALLDADLNDLPQEIQDLYQRDSSKAGVYMAAAYNGGSARVKKAVLNWGEAWAGAHRDELPALKSKEASLKKQILSLLAKVKTAAGEKKKSMDKSIASLRAQRADALAKISKIESGSLYKETVLYVVKLKKVYQMFSNGFFATPNAPSGALPTTVALEGKSDASTA